MAMKFWFGKKETEQGNRETVSCDVLAISGETSSEMPVPPVPTAVFVAPPQQALGMPEAKVTLPQEPKKPVEVPLGAAVPAGAAEPQKVAAEAAKPESAPASPEPVKGAEPAAPAASEKTEGGGAGAGPKPILKPVGAPVRLSAVVRPAGEGPRPLSAPVAAAGAAPGAGRPVFGLRPKGDTGKIQAVPLTAPAQAPAAAAAGSPEPPAKREAIVESETVRPKTDQRALYYQLMNGLYDAVMILDDQGHVVDCNTRFADVLGYSREEAWDLPVDKIITGMSSQMFEHLKRNMAENHHILIDARCFRKDGTSFAGEVGVSTLSLTRGNNIVFAIRNVERRKNAMDELKKSHAALEVALVPSFVCDTDGLFLIVNHTFLEAFGIPDEAQAKSIRFTDLLPDAARFFLRAACGEKIREKLQIGAPNGLPIQLELALAPVQSGQSITGVAGSLLQMT